MRDLQLERGLAFIKRLKGVSRVSGGNMKKIICCKILILKIFPAKNQVRK
jgi:hypothetical protein